MSVGARSGTHSLFEHCLCNKVMTVINVHGAAIGAPFVQLEVHDKVVDLHQAGLHVQLWRDQFFQAHAACDQISTRSFAISSRSLTLIEAS